MARDLFYNIIKESLQTQGWTVTHDPFPIDYGDVQMQIDLGAEHLIAAERETKKIAVEVKSFTKPSAISEFHTAVGQYLNYRYALRIKEPERTLHLAVPHPTYDEFFRLRFITEIVQDQQILLLVYNIQTGDIKWIN